MSDLFSQLIENHSLQRNPTIRSNRRSWATGLPPFHHSRKLPTYPSYLKYTVYAELVEEQYEHQKIRRDRTKTTGITSTFRFKESNGNPIDEMSLLLPSSWNSLDKSYHIQIRKNSLGLFYTGPGKYDSDAASVRSNYPVPPQCGIYYYEVKILSKGENGYIGIGFSGPTNDLDRLPGWDKKSWGYHGDDGFCFSGSGSGVPYGPRFTTGDVIGCCMDFANNTIFYTKNGISVGTAFKGVNPTFKIYPNIGLRTTGEHVITNFGEDPFMFDIDGYVLEQKHKFQKEIGSQPHRMQAPKVTSPLYTLLTDPNSKEAQDNLNSHKQIMEQLILPYLMHQGYTQTARSIIKDTQDILELNSDSDKSLPFDIRNDGDTSSFYNEEIKNMEERQVIKTAVLNGDIDLATKIIQELYPNMLKDEAQSSIIFDLKCQKFIEMMKGYSERVNRANESHESLSPTLPGNEDNLVGEADSNPHLNSQGIDMDIDQPFEDKTHVPSKRANSGTIIDKAIGQGSPIESQSPKNALSEKLFLDNLIQQIISYGEKLQDEYRHVMTVQQREKLNGIFALLAYDNPSKSIIASIMDESNRSVLASKLNTAICGEFDI
ncbi:concanavalin A-like lectin/glucanase domain-containing protein [Phycomyces nitens]|nr:concanavalin A-like lectin/glucanase domain-containing protein [Phycomyces nitens]